MVNYNKGFKRLQGGYFEDALQIYNELESTLSCDVLFSVDHSYALMCKGEAYRSLALKGLQGSTYYNEKVSNDFNKNHATFTSYWLWKLNVQIIQMTYLLIKILFILNTFNTNNKPSQIYDSCPVQIKDSSIYIMIPDTLSEGKITVANEGMYFKDARCYTFWFDQTSHQPHKSNLYFVDVKNKSDSVIRTLSGKKVITLYMLMDSLALHGRPFLRKNNFYAVLKKGNQYYIHKAKCTYLNYFGSTNDYEE